MKNIVMIDFKTAVLMLLLVLQSSAEDTVSHVKLCVLLLCNQFYFRSYKKCFSKCTKKHRCYNSNKV